MWLEKLKEADMPVIVCLTHADFLYDEFITESKEPTDDMKRKIGSELAVSGICLIMAVHA